MHNLRILSLFVFISFISFPFFARQQVEVNFKVDRFNKIFKTAQWLYEYDEALWISSDFLVKKNNQGLYDHFCFQDRDSIWHVIYGKYEKGNFTPAFHFSMDSTWNLTILHTFPDTLFLFSHIRALKKAQQAMAPLLDTLRLHFNFYVRKNEDSTFTVWAFPGIQADGTVVYGGEFEFTLDPSGINMLDTHRYMQNKFRGFPTDHPPEKVTLDYHDVDEPTLGGILFVWEYKRFFPEILLITRKNISTVLQDHTGQYYWVHVDK